MTVMHQMISNTIVQWDDTLPLKWTMSETTKEEGGARTDSRNFDLTPLCKGYETEFLLELKDLVMGMRKRIALSSTGTKYLNIRAALQAMQDSGHLASRIAQIDQVFLLAMGEVVDSLTDGGVYGFKRLFTGNRESALFAKNLVPADFPNKKTDKKGLTGRIISSILSSALSRAAQVEILRLTENAYEAGRIDIGHFSFLNLAFHLYCRPYTYRQLTLGDFVVNVDPHTHVKTYHLRAVLAKTRVKDAANNKYPYPLNRTLGLLLEMQRTHVISTYAHLVNRKDIAKLALFPDRRLGGDGNWLNAHAKAHYGEPDHHGLRAGYLDPIVRLSDVKFDFNGLRHTLGSQLAAAGCSHKTIQAALKHCGDQTCQAYVDIHFQGLVKQLSDSVKPSFENHYPVFDHFRSKSDPLPPEKAIHSEDLESGRIELTGECGRTVACQFAPLSCYSCPRFIPCYDADHSINLTAVDREIDHYKGAGQPFRQLLEKFKDAKRYIMLVMSAADQKRRALEAEKA